MSKYYRKKSNIGTIVGGTIAGLLLLGLVGGVAYKSQGFRNWDIKNWFTKSTTIEVKDERQNLKVLNLKNDVSGSKLNETTLITFLNESLGRNVDPIFEKVMSQTEEVEGEETTTYLINNVYKDNGGLKFGSSSAVGNFVVSLKDYKFNHIKITGRNYSALNSQTNVYSCDVSGISVNGSEAYMFKTNEDDTSKQSPIESKEFTFDSLQDTLQMTGIGKRATILSIELWQDLIVEE